MEKMLGNKKYILIFILPALLLFLGFTLIPLVTSGIYSFFEYNGIGTKTFIGIYSVTYIINFSFGIIKRSKR